MQFKFDAHQEYQVRAIEAVTNLLDGQPRAEMDLTLELEVGLAAEPSKSVRLPTKDLIAVARPLGIEILDTPLSARKVHSVSRIPASWINSV
jgi:hypothetical protein